MGDQGFANILAQLPAATISEIRRTAACDATGTRGAASMIYEMGLPHE